MSSIGGSGKSMPQGPVSAKKQARALLQGEPKQEAGAHSADLSMDFGTDQKQDRRSSEPKSEEASSKTSHASGLSMGAPKIPSLSMSVRGQYSHTTRQQTEPLYSNPKKRPAFELVTAGSLSTAKSTQQSPETKKLKLENDSEEAAEREILRLRGGAKGQHRKITANRSSPAAGASTGKAEEGASAPEVSGVSGTSRPPSTHASSSQSSRAGTLPAALPASKPSSGTKLSFHPAGKLTDSSAKQSTPAVTSPGSAALASPATRRPSAVAAPAASASPAKATWAAPTQSAPKAWGALTPTTVKSSTASLNTALVTSGTERIEAAHPQRATARKTNINLEEGKRLEGPDQHIARPSVAFNKEGSSYQWHVKNHPELLEEGFEDEAQKLAKSECSTESPAWRYSKNVISENSRENRTKGDALKVGRHSINQRPMAVVVTGPNIIKTAFYLTHETSNGKVIDYRDPLTYFNQNAQD